MYKIKLIIALLVLTSSSFAQAQSSRSDSVDIRQIISAYAKTSGEVVQVDPRVKGKISLYGEAIPELSYDNLATILATHNFASYRAGGFLIIVPSNIIKQEPIELVTEGQSYASGQIVTDIIELEKLCPWNLVPILRPLVPPTSQFAPILEPRSILLTDTYKNSQRLRLIVKRLEARMDRQQKCELPDKGK